MRNGAMSFLLYDALGDTSISDPYEVDIVNISNQSSTIVITPNLQTEWASSQLSMLISRVFPTRRSISRGSIVLSTTKINARAKRQNTVGFI